VKGKEELGFCLVAPGVRAFFLLLLLLLLAWGGLLKKPTYYTADSHHLVFQNISQIHRSKAFRKLQKVLRVQLFHAVSSAEDTNEVGCTKSQGRQRNFWELGAQEEQLSLGYGRQPRAPFCSAPSNVPTASAALLELPRPSRQHVFMPLPFKLFRSENFH